MYNNGMDLKQLIQQYLQEAKLMQVATSMENQPWICSVWFAADEDLNIYWLSSTKRRHSAEVIENRKVAAAMALPQNPQDPPRGLQIQGEAELLTNKIDIDKALSVYSGRIFSTEKINEFMSSSENPHRFYRIKPTQFVLYDAIHFPGNARQEYIL